ncbi:helix-turn-helix transcriptional regulator [Streptomyces lavendulae]|uniref:helix-turn-helix transcriptional regulator n=1 Tax=Streptomyces lavendulae TaxID=1914 RepID=UPI0031EDA2B4
MGREAELRLLDEVLAGRGTDGPRVVDLTGAAGIGKSRLLTELCLRARSRGMGVLRGRATEYERHTPYGLFTDAFADLDPDLLRPGTGPTSTLATAASPVLRGLGDGGLGGGGTGGGNTRHGSPAHGDAGDGSPGHGDAGNGDPSHGNPGHGDPRHRSSGHGDAGNGDPSHGDPGHLDPWDGDPGHGNPGDGRTGNENSRHGDTGHRSGHGQGQGGGGPGGGEAVAPYTDRFAVHRATARLLAALSRTGSGLLIALDDLHWADPASLELLDHLVRHPPHAPVLIAVARRDRQTSASLAAALTRGVDTGAVLRLGLGPLPERDCVERLAPGLRPARAARLYAASGGNPLYFLTLLQQDGTGARSPLGGLGSLLLDELTPLTPAQRRTVEAVAVLGDHATPELLAELAPGPAGELDATLRALALRDLARPGPAGSWTLRHPVLRTVVHENADHRGRIRMHRTAAEALARSGAPAPVRAHHVEQALTGWDPAGAAVLLEAAALASATAPASSAHWLAAVLRVLPEGPRYAGQRLTLMLDRARALSVCGELQAGRDLLAEVIDTVPPHDDSGLRPAAVTLCASLERHLGRYARAEALLRRELSRSPAPPPSDLLALGIELGSSAPHSTPYPTVRADVLRTRELARRLGDGAAEADALALMALGEAYEGGLDAAARYADRADALLETLSDRDLALRGESRARLSAASFYLERYGEAERHADRGLALARRVGPPHILSHLLQCKANVLMSTCRLHPALELVEEAETIARGIGSPDLLALALANKAQVLLASLPPGNPESLAVAEEAAAVAGPRTSWWASLAWCVLGFAALFAGKPERARAAMLRAARPDLSGLQPSMRPLFLEALVTATVAGGDLGSADGWAALATADAQRLGLPTQRASALRSTAQLLAARGRTAEAAEAYARAAGEAARSGATLWEAQSLLLGASLAADGPAEAMWHRGRGLAESGGAHLLTGLADLIRIAAPAPPPPPLPGLTPREREIAALVAEGLTTSAIAARLHLSPRTVDTHLSHIYRKTGVTTRSALAALTARATS